MIFKLECWNALEDNFQIYPIEDRPNIINSNAYVIDAPSGIVMIDHGSSPERAGQLETVITELLSRQDKPVIALITHSHMDHAGALRYYSPKFRQKMNLILNRITVDLLSDPDEAEVTNYRIFGAEIPKYEANLQFFADTFQQNSEIAITHENNNEAVKVKGETLIRAWNAPGHSPDCMFFQVGKIIFIGDALYALNPGIIGLPGWNAMQYRHSLQILKNLFKSGISYCCPGHDHAGVPADFVEKLETSIIQAAKYKKVEKMTPERLDFLGEFSRVLLKEIERFLTIISGRIYLLISELEQNGESALAAEFSGMINFDEIESILERFRLALNKDADPNLKLMSGLRGIQTVAKIRKVLQGNRFENLLDPSLLRRTDCLMNDFVNSLSGLPFTGNIETLELNHISNEFLENLLKFAPENSEVPPLIAKKFAELNIFRKVEIKIHPFAGTVNIFCSKEHFFDALQHILERLIGAKAKKITIRIINPGLIISADKFNATDAERIAKGYIRKLLSDLDCRMAFYEDGIILLFNQKVFGN